jgi:hypothetical protein
MTKALERLEFVSPGVKWRTSTPLWPSSWALRAIPTASRTSTTSWFGASSGCRNHLANAGDQSSTLPDAEK